MKGGATTTLMMDQIRQGIEPFLQLMSVDLGGRFHTGLIKTKCLNTAVLVMYLAGGEKGLREAFTCNVDKVIPRYANVFPKSTLDASHVGRIVSTLSSSSRKLEDVYLSKMIGEFGGPSRAGKLHYIMLTDSDMKLVNSTDNETKLFPGHVFVIEQRGKEFHLYQSYINAYDMDTQVRMKNMYTTERSQQWVDRFCTDLEHFVHAKVWDKRCASFWTFLTHTDATGFVGRDKSQIYLCHSELSSEKAYLHFHDYLVAKEAELGRDVNNGRGHQIHGDIELYQRGMHAHLAEHRSIPWTKTRLHEFVRATRGSIEAHSSSG